MKHDKDKRLLASLFYVGDVPLEVELLVRDKHKDDYTSIHVQYTISISVNLKWVIITCPYQHKSFTVV
jgi:hypothetical protein